MEHPKMQILSSSVQDTSCRLTAKIAAAAQLMRIDLGALK